VDAYAGINTSPMRLSQNKFDSGGAGDVRALVRGHSQIRWDAGLNTGVSRFEYCGFSELQNICEERWQEVQLDQGYPWSSESHPAF
jgi:hypothetical protein